MTDTNALARELEALRREQCTLQYKPMAERLGLKPPRQIQQLAELLEAIQEDDALLKRPQRAALVIQKGPVPIPRQGFFQKLKALGVYRGADQGPEAEMWHQNELERLFETDQNSAD